MKIDSSNMHFDSDHSNVVSAAAIDHDRAAIGPRSHGDRASIVDLSLDVIPPFDEDRTTSLRLRFDEDLALSSFHMFSRNLYFMHVL